MVLEPLEKPPLRPRFRRGSRRVEIDLHEVMHSIRNGLQVPTTLSGAIAREGRFLRWLAKVGGVGTRPEFMCYEALERMGMRAPQSTPYPGMDFEFQVPVLGGRGQKGGAVIDLMVHVVSPRVAIRVQGEFWHYVDAPTREADIIERIAIQNLGYKVVDILSQDTIDEQRTAFVVGLALNGFELDPAGRLGVFR